MDKLAEKQYEEVFDEGAAPKEQRTVQRMRANSSIMHVNKILGESCKPLSACAGVCSCCTV